MDSINLNSSAHASTNVDINIDTNVVLGESADTESGIIDIKDIRERVLLSLKEVFDPEIHINIVDLGLIYRVDVSEDAKVTEIDFTLTTPGCPLADVIEEDIKQACKKVLPDTEVITTLVWTPMWNADFMSEDARLELGFPI